MAMALRAHDALLIVDVQRDFLPGGALAVPDGDAVVPVLNRYIALARATGMPVIASRDWHPANHCSFTPQGGPWPPHCVAGSEGAQFARELELPVHANVIDKATTQAQDAYSAFELYMRRLPPNRNFMMAAGLEQALDFLESLRFSPDELEWIESSGLFAADFARELERMRFTGDVHAMPEGTIFFPEEPVLRITAPLPEAQLIESRLINLIHFGTLIASKAARSVLAAPGKTLVDFGFRRAHGAEAGILAARASYIAGFAGTATVVAGRAMGIPLFGTMAHSFVQAHDDESEAFTRFLQIYPQGTTLLIDTYDTEAAARKIAALAGRLNASGATVKAVRLDSGDLTALAKSVRRILDDAGLRHTSIFASGNLDEYRIRDLIAARAPIDGFGIGTSLVTSADAPSLDAVYKLQEYGGKPRCKRSPGKATWPGRKQVYRHYDEAGRFGHDVLMLESEQEPDAEPLLVGVMKHGRRLGATETLQAIRERAASQLPRLPERLKALDTACAPYCVRAAPALHKLAEDVMTCPQTGGAT